MFVVGIRRFSHGTESLKGGGNRLYGTIKNNSRHSIGWFT